LLLFTIQVAASELSAIYRAGIETIRQRVLDAPIKEFGGRPVTGPGMMRVGGGLIR
jgi:hypothetical protein